MHDDRGEAMNFCLRGSSCNSNIFIKTTSTYTYIHAFLLYTHTFLFDKIYIYTSVRTYVIHLLETYVTILCN